MKVAVLGATGPSGLQVVLESLERGHEVIALVRNPSKLQSITDPKLKIEKVDIFNEDELCGQFKSCDVILSCLGCKPSFFGMSTITFYMETIKPIIAGLRKAGKQRLVCMTSWDTIPQHNGPWLFENVFRPMFMTSVLQSMSIMEKYLVEECVDIDYIIVKPPGLSNMNSKGKSIRAEEGQGIPGVSRRMSRRDVAKFMLDCIPNREWFHKFVAVATP